MLKRLLRLTLLCACWSLPLPSAAEADTSPATDPVIRALTDPQGFTAARLSPDGRHLAAIGFSGFNLGLVVLDVATLKSKFTIFGTTAIEGHFAYRKRPLRVLWITNELIGVDYGYTAEAVNLEGKVVSVLGERLIGKADHDRPDSPMVLVETDIEDGDTALVNAVTRAKTKFRYPMSGKVVARAFDSKGELRAMTMANSQFWKDITKVSNWYRASATAPWEQVDEVGVADEYWTPVSVPDEENTMLIRSRIDRDTYAIFEYNTKLRKIGELAAGHPTQDIVDLDTANGEKFQRVQTDGLLPETVWFDPEFLVIQRAVDAALPNKINQISGDPKNKILIYSYSDRDPGSYYLLDQKKQEFKPILKSRMAIDAAKMLPMERLTYQAGDGMKIPSYLTRPPNIKGPAPTVIMIHGGPTARDHWRWDADVQFLAARGYVVFQPQFRGSTGFGKRFETAGYGQWGLSMQDDITAGVAYLVEQKISDPARICIYGASYGGYAAMWGLVKTPDLYKCGVSYAGVSDIYNILSGSSDLNSDKVAREILKTRIGDRERDEARFDAVSPLKHAAKIKAPVLLMHGDADERVPISHLKKMKRALESNGKTVETVIFPDEGHSLSYVKHHVEFLEKLGGFLDKHIGAPIK